MGATWFDRMRPDLQASRIGMAIYYPFDLNRPPFSLLPLAEELLRQTGNPTTWEKEGLQRLYTPGWTVARQATHMAVRLAFRYEAKSRPFVIATLGRPDESLAPWMTATVLGLLGIPQKTIHLPIIADALQDAGMPEDHPMLDRCRDLTVPFMRNEWLHREAKKVRRTR